MSKGTSNISKDNIFRRNKDNGKVFFITADNFGYLSAYKSKEEAFEVKRQKFLGWVTGKNPDDINDLIHHPVYIMLNSFADNHDECLEEIGKIALKIVRELEL